MKIKLLKKGDLIALASLLAVCAVIAALIFAFGGSRSGGDTVVVRQNGEVSAQLPLSKSGSAEYDVVSNGKTVNTVLVKDGAVSMIYADCPDGVCTAHAPISRAGERIICLPNRVEISIESSSSNELDGVAR